MDLFLFPNKPALFGGTPLEKGFCQKSLLYLAVSAPLGSPSPAWPPPVCLPPASPTASSSLVPSTSLGYYTLHNYRTSGPALLSSRKVSAPMQHTHPQPTAIQVRGARVHNLKDVSLDIPLNKFVGIAGVSGSGKSSLALGVLYAEGSRRYLEALSTYTRRRLTQAAKASVDEVLYVPAALALHQRPAVPGIRSTFGTSTELLNSLRLLFSRVGSHVCPNGHRRPPTLNVALEQPIECPTCGAQFYGPSAEDLSFNGGGACPTCDGTGIVRRVDESTLVPDESLTIDEGAVAPWNQLMWSLMKDVCREMGVRTDVPFKRPHPAREGYRAPRPGREEAHPLPQQDRATPTPSWTLPTSTPSTPWRTPWPRPRTRRPWPAWPSS